jgi:transposase
MTTAATRNETLFLGIELSKKTWRLAFSNGQKIRQRSVAAGDQQALRQEIDSAREKLALTTEAPVESCYETGRDGFWADRLLAKLGVNNLVVDAASIETARRGRRAKTDRLDAEKLVRKLMDWHRGDRQVWRVARVPSVAEEDQRRPQRELLRLKKERTAHRARISSLLALHGLAVKLNGRQQLPAAVRQLRDWNGEPLPGQVAAELERELGRLKQLHEQIVAVERQQSDGLKQPQTTAEKLAAQLLRLRGLGPVSAWLLACEMFAWRNFRNRREVGAAAGLCGTPYDSGQSSREQGISKAGNKRIRWVMVELAWSWLRFQPDSELSQWFWRRFGQGNGRMRRIGIVALARKLLVALWKYLQRGEVPAGAVMKSVAA